MDDDWNMNGYYKVYSLDKKSSIEIQFANDNAMISIDNVNRIFIKSVDKPEKIEPLYFSPKFIRKLKNDPYDS